MARSPAPQRKLSALLMSGPAAMSSALDDLGPQPSLAIRCCKQVAIRLAFHGHMLRGKLWIGVI
jgi:hypothetical protein